MPGRVIISALRSGRQKALFFGDEFAPWPDWVRPGRGAVAGCSAREKRKDLAMLFFNSNK
jgi:hypothetical protein